MGLGLHCLPPPRLHDYYDCYDDLYTAILLYHYTTLTTLPKTTCLPSSHAWQVAGARWGGGRWEVVGGAMRTTNEREIKACEF